MKPKAHYEILPHEDTLAISQAALEAQKKDPTVINATLGSLYNDDHQLVHFKAVDEAIKSLPTTYPYTPSTGDLSALEAYLSWILPESFTYPHAGLWTNGGTGALYLAFDCYMNPEDAVVYGIPCWNNYPIMLKHLNVPGYTYPLFTDDNEFNLKGLFELLDETSKKHKRIMLLINDPAHNPTGYSMSIDEWILILNKLETLSKTNEVVLLIDMAYMDFSADRQRVLKLINHTPRPYLILGAYSGSKSFSLYGARIGALVAFSSEKEEFNNFKKATLFSARSTYSLPSVFGQRIVSMVLGNTSQRLNYSNELMKYRDLITKRSELLMRNLNDLNHVTYPYVEGFFMTIKTDDPQTKVSQLINKKTYTINVDCGVRVALSALNQSELDTIK